MKKSRGHYLVTTTEDDLMSQVQNKLEEQPTLITTQVCFRRRCCGMRARDLGTVSRLSVRYATTLQSALACMPLISLPLLWHWDCELDTNPPKLPRTACSSSSSSSPFSLFEGFLRRVLPNERHRFA
eukprot:3482959-Amphidinium_carterae.2